MSARAAAAAPARHDLRGLLAIAIDDPGAAEVDDAVSVGDEGEVWVHIADVGGALGRLPPSVRASLQASAQRRGAFETARVAWESVSENVLV